MFVWAAQMSNVQCQPNDMSTFVCHYSHMFYFLFMCMYVWCVFLCVGTYTCMESSEVGVSLSNRDHSSLPKTGSLIGTKRYFCRLVPGSLGCA